MEKITFCIPSKNNLRYLKNSILSIRRNSSMEHDIIVYVDADNDGTLDWLKANQVPYLTNHLPYPQGIAHAYNRCIEAAKTNVVCMFHADMVLGANADENLLKHLRPKNVVSATRIEPPLHPSGKEKITQNFGMYPEDFNSSAFDHFVIEYSTKNKDITTKGIFAPWLAYRSELIEIGMHDEILHSYYEDSDIFQRLILNGCTMTQSWDALVYHFTCRGGQFQDGIEKVTDNPEFHKMRDSSGRYYIRKWGSWISNDEHQHPILHKKFDIGFIIRDAISIDFLHFIEPWASVIYVGNWPITENYIKTEQTNTKVNLSSRIKLVSQYIPIHDVLIEFSQKDFMLSGQENASIIQNLSAIIEDSAEPNSVMELGCFTLTTKSLTDISSTLIRV